VENLIRENPDVLAPLRLRYLRWVLFDTKSVQVLARQPIDMARPHPFTEAGNREFNMFVWVPPTGARAGDILIADSTIFSTLFGGDESLERFWKNIAVK
jgi:hypothetical protein